MKLSRGVLLGILLLAGCGSSTTPPPPIVLTISGNTFSPANLAVPQGATVTVKNNDAVGHSITSQTTAGSYVAGPASGVTFDTGVFTSQASFTVPSTATVGAVLPYFCTVHKSMMLNQGVLTVTAASSPGY